MDVPSENHIITDGTGQRSLANVNMTISGESAGSPDEALALTIGRFIQSAYLANRTMPSEIASPKTVGLVR